MDVRCERCGTEYEFEDNRVTEEGVTVKCSTCGHLFKIRKKSFVLTEPVTLGKKGVENGRERSWMVRKRDGTILSFKELTTLQKWIVERRVSREDEISKSGDTWKQLGGIAELASFFRVVDQATPAPISITGSGTQPLPAAVPPTSSFVQPVPQAPAQMIPATTAAPTLPPQPRTAYPSQPSMPAFGQVEPDSWGMPSYAEAEDDVVEKWKRRGRRKWYVIGPLLVVVVGVGIWWLASPATFMLVVDSIIGRTEQIPELALTQFKSGYQHFLKDSFDELDLALKDLHAAIQEAGGIFPQAMGTVAEVYITRADKQAERVSQLEKEIASLEEQIKQLMPTDGREPKAQVKKKIEPLDGRRVELQKERLALVDAARKDLDEAKRQIYSAREVDPNAFAPKRALVDYLRVMNTDRAQMEVPLKEAQVIQENDPELLYVDGASLAQDPASLDIAAKKLNQAIELQQQAGKPDLLRARYKLAAVLIQQKLVDDAKVQLQRILQETPNHLQAKDLLASLEPRPGAEAPTPKDKEPEEPADYQSWMLRATSLQEQGRAKEALDAFDAALEVKPDDVDALTGKGLCFLDLGSYRAAISWFKRALKVNPKFGDAIMGLAESHKYLGEKEEAIKYYQRYLEMLPDGEEAEVARRNLSELK